MSDQAMQPNDGKDEIPEKCIHPQQSVWMSHWTRSSFRPVNDTCNQLSLRDDSGEDSHRAKHRTLLHGSEIESGSSKFVKEFQEMHKALINENSTSSKKLMQETFKGQHFPMFKSFKKKESILPLKNGERESPDHHEEVLRPQIGTPSGRDVSLGRTDRHLPSMLQLGPFHAETRSMESQFEHEGITSNPEQQVKSKKFLGSTSRTVPSEFNGVSTPSESFICRQDHTTRPSSSPLVHEKKNNSASLLIHDPPRSNNQLRDFVGEQLQMMPNHSNVTFFGNQTTPPEATLSHGSYELQRISSSLHNVETMRIYTTIDSVKEFIRGPPAFSQTTHHLLITEKADVNLSEGGQLFRDSTISKYKGKPMDEFPSLAPDIGFNIKQGLKLQPLDSSTESEGIKHIESVHTSAVDLKNESSAETDTMDMDTLRKNHLSGVASSVSNKDIKGTQKSSSSQDAIASVHEESRDRMPNIDLPDINQELPVIHGVSSLANDGEASISRTQSLDVEHFLPHTERPTSSKSITCADGPLGLDPCSRWVKRLKSSASCSFGYGTKSLKMGEASSYEKVNKLFSKILNCKEKNSEPKMNKSHGKEPMLIDQTAELLRNAESSSADSGMKCQEVTLSHAWIQRWCHKPAISSKRKPETVVVCEPESSKLDLDDFQKKQFPSITAMALMGKAMTSFRPCEFRKNGSFVVWNTKR